MLLTVVPTMMVEQQCTWRAPSLTPSTHNCFTTDLTLQPPLHSIDPSNPASQVFLQCKH
jgi:hypothetical protein